MTWHDVTITFVKWRHIRTKETIDPWRSHASFPFPLKQKERRKNDRPRSAENVRFYGHFQTINIFKNIKTEMARKFYLNWFSGSLVHSYLVNHKFCNKVWNHFDQLLYQLLIWNLCVQIGFDFFFHFAFNSHVPLWRLINDCNAHLLGSRQRLLSVQTGCVHSNKTE